MNRKYIIIALVIIGIILIFSTIFSLLNMGNSNIVSGVKIQGIDVSGLSLEEAKSKIELLYKEKREKDITLKYKDYTATINAELIEAKYNIEETIEKALKIGRSHSIIENNYEIISAMMGKFNIDLNIQINEKYTKKTIEDISSKLPDAVVESGYYTEKNTLIITKGKEGTIINTEKLTEKIKQYLYDSNPMIQEIEIPVEIAKPKEIDIDKIYKEIHKEPQDAYFTKKPFKIYPEVEGISFDLKKAKKQLKKDKKQYKIKLKLTKADKTVADLGSEAFPTKIGYHTTNYDTTNKDRSTNLKLACEKINNKIVLPGETFSYNKTLGERSIEAGYKNAKIYSNGEVVDGLGGGICQISSTLYNAVLRANMEVVERRNHQFVTSYVPAGRDATVVYGLTDFKFKNTRTYAIKIKAKAAEGIASVEIYGIKEDKEYNISFNTKTISTIPVTVKYEDDPSLPSGKEVIKQKGANGVITETYIIKSLNGKIVSNELLSKDTYNAMQKIIKRGTK